MTRAVGIGSAMLSGLLLAAHFLRAGLYPLVALALVFPFLLFARRPWATRLVRALLVLSAVEWLRTLFLIAHQRWAEGQSWVRMATILGAVAFFTLGSAFAVRDQRGSTVR